MTALQPLLRRWSQWRPTRLPRARRDTLFALAVTGWICALQIAHQPLWCSCLTFGVLLWHAWLTLRGAELPARSWRISLALVGVAATAWTYHGLLVRDAGVTIVLILLALKTLELRTQRDAYALFMLGFFALLCNFLYSQSLPTAAAMLVGAFCLLALLINSHMPVGRPSLWQLVRTSLRMALLGAPLTVLLFVFFPRMAPLWGVLTESQRANSGLSNNMQIGNIASLALDTSVALRIHFYQAVPPQQDLYFRGPVLTHFDGQEWTPSAPIPAAAKSARMGLELVQPAVTYDVTLEPSQQNWLLVLEATPQAPELASYHSYLQSDLQWRVNRPLTQVVHYRAYSYPHYHYGPRTWEDSLRQDLQLPTGFNPRTVQWANHMRQDPRYAHADSRELVLAVLNHLRNDGYTYTLEPGLFGKHSADEFWFDRKQGFCEHIAAAFVIMMRALQVPARIVTGYQGGDMNPLDHDWTIRQSDAHAWAEVWLADRGWTRVDPTAAVAPLRTSGAVRVPAPQNLFGQALAAVNPDLITTGRAAWDALNSGWNQWVLNYSQTRQFNLLRQLGFDMPDWQLLVQLLATLLSATSLIGVAWLYYLQRRQDPWLRLLNGARQQLQRAGFLCAAHMPPRALARMLQQAHGAGQSAAVQAIVDWLLRLEAWRYANPQRSAVEGIGSERARLGTLRSEFHQLQWPRQLPTEHPAP